MKVTLILHYNDLDGNIRQVEIKKDIPVLGIWLDKDHRQCDAILGKWYIPAAQFTCIERVVK